MNDFNSAEYVVTQAKEGKNLRTRRLLLLLYIVLGLAYRHVEEETQCGDDGEDGRKCCCRAVFAAPDVDIRLHGEGSGLVAVKYDRARQLCHDGDPAEDRAGEDTV